MRHDRRGPRRGLSASRALALLAALLVLAASACRPSGDAAGAPRPPRAEVIPHELTAHGHTRVDNYYWLNERGNPKVLEYLEAENAYTRAVLKPLEPLQERLYGEFVGRIKQTDLSVPYRDNGYFYYTRYEDGKDYPVHCRKKGSLEGAEEVLLDVNEVARGHGYCHVTGLTVSPDNRLLAYGVDTVSRRKYTIRFKDLATGAALADAIPLTTGAAAWAADNATVFYTRIDDETLRPQTVFRHVLGTPVESDALVFHEADETFTVGAHAAKSRKYIFIASSHTLSNEYRFVPADTPAAEFKVFQPRERGLEYDVDHYKDKFFVRTNMGAKNFRLMTAGLGKTGKADWAELIPHRDDVLLESFELFKGALVVEERKNGLVQLRVMPWDKAAGEHYVDFGEAAYSAWFSNNPEFDTDWLRFGYESLTTPGSVFDYNMVTREKKLLKREEVLGGFDAANYRAERLYAPARDGVEVPVSIVYRKGFVKDGTAPCLLYGYGSYGASTDADFDPARLSLLDRGFVYAIAHIRGGQELGRAWYEDGKLFKKKNTFTDFIDCAERLVAEKYTRPARLFAEGASAGGLLMGAVVNMRPDLFKGALVGVPFVDVVTTMLDTSIPLTTGEFDEWGNPAVKECYDYMLSYSPYDRLVRKAYPALFVTTGWQDSQVQYFEPAKYVAKLRTLKTDRNPLLLWTNIEGGHGGVSGRFRRLEQTAMEYAFILDLAEIRE
ncbi:MAG TPA: S9 family peptidase [Candidatus Aminicenantes bacterium]|nr:S9 family peptidase [Candidatus Aminicenantes bacterium]